jgi:DNA-binding GntR family transcriptional regulator
MKIADMIDTRRTSADIVFEQIYDQIITLGLMPGDKISEAEVAERFGISRQPVRDAFNRLDNLRLIQIQPQRATMVKKFSLPGIAAARFIRLALEIEIIKVACQKWSPEKEPQFVENLAAQERAVDALDQTAFHGLDEEFHRLIADTADAPFAFELILQKKAQVDRICVLSLKDGEGMRSLLDDHRQIFELLRAGDATGAEAVLRVHLSRIESTIDKIHREHADYFE